MAGFTERFRLEQESVQGIGRHGNRLAQQAPSQAGIRAISRPLRVQTAAYLASDTTCSIAERAVAGQDFGNLTFDAEFDMLAPGMTESGITNALVLCYG